jgi:hypothetical protein
VRAGVPAALDEITSQVLLLRDRGSGPVVTTPAQLSTALLAAIPPVPIPQLPPSSRNRADTHRQSPRSARVPEYRSPDEREPEYWSPDGQREYWSPDGQPESARSHARQPSLGPPAGASRVVVIAVVAALVAAGLAFAAYRSLSGGSSSTPRGSSTHHSTAPRTGAGTVVLTPASATGFDESRDSAPLAIDNNSSTFWATSWYRGSPYFGKLKQGSGLILDMGRSVRLSSVQVTFGSTAGADVEIKIGNSNAQGPDGTHVQGQATAAAMQTVASKTNVGGTVTFTTTSNATGRYVLIWFTKLPPWTGHSGLYQAQIYNVVVRGSS